MTQFPIVSGIYADTTPELRTSYPVNLIPTPKESGISSGYLRPADGILSFGTGPGDDRGGINWNGLCYRVMGSKLVSVSDVGVVSTLGDVGNNNLPVSLDYGFDRLAIASNEDLFYWDGSTLTQVTDSDLGVVLDVIWIGGYYMTTDGEYLVVTDLNDPTAVNPLKYGSSEVDPDPIKKLFRLNNEAVAINRYTIEFFDNVGGSLFPFSRIEGALIEKGCVGTHACCLYAGAIAFLGSGRNEQISIYLGLNGKTQKIATQEIDTLLENYTETELALVEMEMRVTRAHQFLYLHLPDRTLVYDGAASAQVGQPVWFTLTTTIDGFDAYEARHFTRCYDKWLCAYGTKIGYLTDTVSSHWGNEVRWEFATQILYNEGKGVIFHELELVALTGSYTIGDSPTIWTQYSLDGVTWSSQRVISAGTTAERAKRLVWFSQGSMRNWRIQRCGGTSQCHASFVRFEGKLEGLAY